MNTIESIITAIKIIPIELWLTFIIMGGYFLIKDIKQRRKK